MASGAPPKKPSPDAAQNARLMNSVLTKHQRQSYGSNFAETTAERELRRAQKLALTSAQPPVGSGIHPAFTVPTDTTFDGKTVPEALQSRDVWRLLHPPVSSTPGRRESATYDQAIKQFGLTVNPRYQDDAPGKPRGHVFVWDVSKAMGCEIPHFQGAREYSLAQTCDWLRFEGPMQGWKRIVDLEAFEAANAGRMVVAMPRDKLNKLIALVAPQAKPVDNRPRLTGAGRVRSDYAPPRELFGSVAIDCFVHD